MGKHDRVPFIAALVLLLLLMTAFAQIVLFLSKLLVT
jgi:hypothetical protein